MAPTFPSHRSADACARRWIIVSFALLLAACSSAPKQPVAAAPRARATAPTVIPLALSLTGTPYRWGGNTPDEGFDCSGFVRYVFSRYGVYLPRRAVEQAEWVPNVPFHARRAGDLVFFDTGTPPVSHVGIYLGRDEFVHASSAGGGRVIVSSLMKPYWREHLVAVGRPPPPRR
ncbi:MAG: C40 family peptidase [Methylotetracoccus sp.]